MVDINAVMGENERLRARVNDLTKHNEMLIEKVRGWQQQHRYLEELMRIRKYVDIKQTCPKCGLDFSQSMCYTCNDAQCPTGMGPITCQSG